MSSNRIVTTAFAAIALVTLGTLSAQARLAEDITLNYNPSANTDAGKYTFGLPDIYDFDRNANTYVLIHGFGQYGFNDATLTGI